MDIFSHYAPFIQEFIYQNNWKEIRAVQTEAAKSIFLSDNNVLICAKTASGKTEAAFFPVLSELEKEAPMSFGAIYLAPLKTLINDQFKRIDLLLRESNTPVFHWHGDVSYSHKKAAIKNPRGILQITPESLEGMMVNRTNNIYHLFNDLKFIIIDEIHFMAGTDRGNQIKCILERLARIIKRHPRRIGLSATIGDPLASAEWLGEKNERGTDIVFIKDEKYKFKLACEHFFTADTKSHTVEENQMYENYGDKYSYFLFSDEANKYIYKHVKNKLKSLIFLNTREETEYMTATLRGIAEIKREKDIFYIHHGSISKQLREETEADMKDEHKQTVTCATVSMELGIDIGYLERIVHLGAPNSVSSFLQRMGRSGRRDIPPEMMIIINEDIVKPDALLPHSLPWELLKSIAVAQLYIEERWIEPPVLKKMPFSLLFHQTLTVLAAAYELKPDDFFERILTLSPFRHVEEEDYRILLRHMLKTKMLQLTDERTVIVGLEGEKLINSYKFLATFKAYEEYKVMHGTSHIGTLTGEMPIGDIFTLAGITWEVAEVVPAQKVILVKKAEGYGAFPWPGTYRDIHTKIIRQIRKILMEDTPYPYLKPRAAERLNQARAIARSSGILAQPIVHLGGKQWALFPWLGSKSNWALRRFVKRNCVKKFGLTDIEYGDWYYIRLNINKGDGNELINDIKSFFNHNSDLNSLVGEKENPVYERYDVYVPQELIRKGYVVDKMDGSEVKEWLGWFDYK
ncbi:MAG: DEAD/DEAH box helicase [Defluviitaleaceae bacterium]|nr:DEAD/DEAH box helicase [Defluviitaleaceae bacterium]